MAQGYSSGGMGDMGIVAFNPVVQGISGKMGNLVFYTRRGRACVRAHVVPRDPRTEKQAACRKAFASLVAAWKAMGEHERKDWNDRARGRNFSGFNAFISSNMKIGAGARSRPLRRPDRGEAPPNLQRPCAHGERGNGAHVTAPCGAICRVRASEDLSRGMMSVAAGRLSPGNPYHPPFFHARPGDDKIPLARGPCL